MLSTAGDDLRLELDRTDSSGSITLEYKVSNLLNRPLFLFNVLHGEMAESGTFPLEEGAYVELDQGIAIVSRKLFPLPRFMFVEKRNIPFATRIPPGETFRESLGLDLPLRPNNPYVDTDPQQSFDLEQRPLIFEIGYFVGAEGTEELGRSFPTDQGPRMGFDVFTESAQKLQRVGPSGAVQVAVPTASRNGG